MQKEPLLLKRIDSQGWDFFGAASGEREEISTELSGPAFRSESGEVLALCCRLVFRRFSSGCFVKVEGHGSFPDKATTPSAR